MKTKSLVIVGLSSILLAGVASAKQNKKKFEDVDTDKDGKVSEAEFIVGAKDEAKAKKRFKKKDKDADGFLSKREFAKKKKKKGPKKEKKGPQKEKDAN